MDGLQDIWVYINKRGQLIETPACISSSKPSKWSYIIPAVDRDNYTYIQEVAREPGMIFNDSVWFKKKNFSKAKDIFMTDYSQRIKTMWFDYCNLRDEFARLDSQEEEK